MSLRDVMSSAGLAGFAEVALLLFLGVFVAICASVLRKGTSPRMEVLRRLPLDNSTHLSKSRPFGKSTLPDVPHPRFHDSEAPSA